MIRTYFSIQDHSDPTFPKQRGSRSYPPGRISWALPLPPYAWDLNIAEGALNHFKQMVSAVMLAAMVPGGPIDESFVGRAAEIAAGLTSAWSLSAGAWTASCPPGGTISALMLVWRVQWLSEHRASRSSTRS